MPFTAVYIINRLPTPTLEHMSPYFKLFNKDPDYKALQVFRCLCFPLLRPYGLHKLEYRSKPCIFLGHNHAGYKCLDPISNKVFLSRHVVFDEGSFPAKDQATPPLPSKLAASGNSLSLVPVMLPHLHHSDSLSASLPPPNTHIPIVDPTLSSPIISPSPNGSAGHTPPPFTSQDPYVPLANTTMPSLLGYISSNIHTDAILSPLGTQVSPPTSNPPSVPVNIQCCSLRLPYHTCHLSSHAYSVSDRIFQTKKFF